MSQATIKRRSSQKLKRIRRRSIYYEQKSQIYRKVAKELSEELYSSKLKVDSLQDQLSMLERKLGNLCTRNVHKREKRSATQLAMQKKEIDEQKGKMDALRTENAALKYALQNEAKKNREKVHMMRQKNKKRKQVRDKYQKRWCRLHSKYQALQTKCDSSHSSESESCDSCDDKDVLEVQIDELREASGFRKGPYF